MRSLVRLAVRALLWHRVRTLLLILCLVLAFLLPVAVHLLVARYSERLMARAEATPFVAGAQGSRFDLVLSSLYFRGRLPRTTSMAALARIEEGDLARAIPVHAGLTVRGHPLVGIDPAYFQIRDLRPEVGSLPLLLGDCVAGSALAAELELKPGDFVLTDAGGLYELGLEYPLRLHVRGVLRPTGGPDDRAFFTDVKSVWIALGVGHGHRDAAAQDPQRVLSDEGGQVDLDSGVMTYTEVTPENLSTFHFHGGPEDLPLTAILIWPHDERARTLLKGRFRVASDAQLLQPTEVLQEVLSFVLAARRFFDANALAVTLSTLLFLALVVGLTLRLRAKELATYGHLGASRGFVAGLLTVEWLLVVGAAALVTVPLAALLARLLQGWIPI